MARVLLAMSGGVDSSVAAHLLQTTGHEVVGVFMRHGAVAAQDQCATPTGSITGAHKQGCCSAADAADARRVADQLDIPFYALDLQADFGRIIDYFVDEYSAGRTPNPCIVCNQWLKFGRLFAYADTIGAEFVATGHYARCLQRQSGQFWLTRGVDDRKDQSYVLFGIARALLSRMLLPVGDHTKGSIRELALKLGLNVARKRDSQEICFLPPGQHGQLVRRRRPHQSRSGRIVTVDGKVVGSHDGIENFTIGQRKGLGIAMGVPYFVVRIDPATFDVLIGPRSTLARRSVTGANTNWLADMPQTPFRCLAKIRYNSPPAAATAQQLPNQRLRVEFDEPVFGVAPGQAVVCYASDRVLGGGWIE